MRNKRLEISNNCEVGAEFCLGTAELNPNMVSFMDNLLFYFLYKFNQFFNSQISMTDIVFLF